MDPIATSTDWNSFEEWQPYDVADLLKQFLRELPECLLTNKLSSTLINIFHRYCHSIIEFNQLEKSSSIATDQLFRLFVQPDH
ncbi:hypothetical protein ACTXT7_007709 [Hymenolepis weldensis]